MEQDKNLGWFKINRNTIYNICANTDTIACTIYIILLSHMNNDTGNCYPSLNTLAKECNCSKKTVQNKINMLEEKGYIKHNSGTLGKENGQNLANSYYFLTNDRNKNVDEVKESLATKKKKTYKKKDKFNTNTNKDEEIVNNIVKEVEYNLKDDEDYEYKSNEYDIKIIEAVNKKLDELKKEIYDS